MIKHKHTKHGFTLLEMLVSLGIFSIVAVVAVGSLVRITGLNRQAQTLQASMSNVGYALSSLSNDLRDGSNYACVDETGLSGTNINWDNTNPDYVSSITPTFCERSDFSNESKFIVFTSKDRSKINGDCKLIYAYGFIKNAGSPATWTLKKYEQSACGDLGGKMVGNYSPVIDEVNTKIESFQLGVFNGGVLSGSKYPWGFIRIKGYAGDREKDRNYFDVQTGVSSRIAE